MSHQLAEVNNIVWSKNADWAKDKTQRGVTCNFKLYIIKIKNCLAEFNPKIEKSLDQNVLSLDI